MSVNYIDKSTGDLIRVAGGGNDILYADSPIGSIIPFGGITAPDGFLLCQGQAVSRTTYAELFAVIGTSFGNGDGSTTFNVPDLRGKVPVGLSSSDTEFNTLGKTGGEKTHKLVISEMPSHTHLTGISPNTAFDVELKDSGVSAEVTWLQNRSNTSPTGGDGAHNNIQPYNTVNYIIKAAQVGAPADFAPVDVVENGNMKAVTSNAVAKAIETKVFTGSATKSAYVTAGDITWQWTGRICRVLFEGVKIAANTPFLSAICTGLPPSNGTEFLTVCAEYPTNTAAGFLRADRNIGKLLADASVGGQAVEVTLYASVSYITSEDAHQI